MKEAPNSVIGVQSCRISLFDERAAIDDHDSHGDSEREGKKANFEAP